MDAFLKNKLPKKLEKMEIQNTQKHHETIPWVEKYRPHKLNELSYQQQVTKSFAGVVKSGNLPHLLLYGAAGTGKTSSILAMAKELYGPNFYKQRILELNASDDRGIGAVRQKIKRFAMNLTTKNYDKTYLCPNYKIIILDQADSMTNQAQSALRRIIQDFSTTTRFAIICNYITKIIEPLASRCVKFRFKPIPQQIQLLKLQEICQKQNLKIERQILLTLLSQGDLRRSINSLQSLHNVSTIPQVLPMPQKVCSKLFEIMVHSNHLNDVLKALESILSDGWPFDQLLNGLLNQILEFNNEKIKAELLEVIAKADQAINEGGSEIQIIQAVSTSFYVIHLY